MDFQEALLEPHNITADASTNYFAPNKKDCTPDRAAHHSFTKTGVHPQMH
jgi:hypothetical protein